MRIEQIIAILREWKNKVESDISISQVFLFGSSVINNGFLFDDNTSDIDLVVFIPDSLVNAVERTEWLKKLKEHKADLEIEFVKLLKRNRNDKPIVSIIPITMKELLSDIHKSGVRDFFRDNEFLNIETNERFIGLIKDEDLVEIDDVVRNLFEFSQSIRNKYLAIGFVSTKHSLDWQSIEDVAPKELIRTSALAAYIENGKKNREEKTDLKIGLSYLQFYVYSRRHESPFYHKLTNWLGKRLLRKGEQPNLENTDYLFLSEIIFDMALSLIPETKASKQTVSEVRNTTLIDTTKSIDVTFYIGKNGLISGPEGDVEKEIVNAAVNLAWKTEPYFEIALEEINSLQQQINRNSKDGKSIDKLRKLKLIQKDLLEGFKYIIYYQNYFFKGSDNILSDILACLRKFTLTRFANVLSDNNYKGVEEGFLEAYIYDYGNLNNRFPNIKIKGVLKFGLPESELNKYLKSNKYLSKKGKNVGLETLAAYNQPIRTLNTSLLANFFVPLLVQRLVECSIDATSDDVDTRKFNNEFTNLHFWSFGVY
jgi:predicted nucleotidyltransferase